jgi:8-oxo-dGTP diphosphatase
VDIIVLHKTVNNNKILLIERKHPPFKNCWALPGGFIEMEETLEQSAIRELQEETGINLIKLQPFSTYGNPGRDPRGRTISIVFYAIIDKQIALTPGDDASNAKWINIKKLPSLAFDHKKIIEDFIINVSSI